MRTSNHYRSALFTVLFLLLLASLTACQLGFLAKPGTGSGQITISLPATDSPTYANVGQWHIKGSGPGTAFDETVYAGASSFSIGGLAIGPWTITIEGLVASDMVGFTSTQTLQINAGNNSAEFVMVALNPVRLLARWTFDNPANWLTDSVGQHTLDENTAKKNLGLGYYPGFFQPLAPLTLVDGPQVINFGNQLGMADQQGSAVDLGLINLGNRFTVSVWVRLDTDGSYSGRKRVLLSNQDPLVTPANGHSTGKGFTIALNDWWNEDNRIYVETSNGATLETVVSNAATPLVIGRWHLVTVAFDKLAGMATISINGVMAGSGPAVKDFASTGQSLRLGGLPAGDGTAAKQGYYFYGQLDDLRLYSGAMTAKAVMADAVFAGGSGTPADPWLVANAQQLNNVRYFPNACFKQTADINLGTFPWNAFMGWQPICQLVPGFSGTYDGQDHNITGLTSIGSATSNIGLFGQVVGGSIRHCKLSGVNINANASYVGGLVAYLENGLVSNCSIDGVIANSLDPTGGLVGIMYQLGTGTSTVSDCQASMVLTSFTNSGGLVGRSSAFDKTLLRITGCSTSGSINSSSFNTGGLAGIVVGTVSNCTSSTIINSSGASAGGLIGEMSSGQVSQCSASGTVQGNSASGGLVGRLTSTSTIHNSHASGTATAVGSMAGGLVGTMDVNSTKIEQSYATGKASTGADMAGGLVGYGTGTVKLSYALGGVDSVSGMAGGLVGINMGSINDCYASGTIYAVSGNSGGISGNSPSANIDRCWAAVSLTGANPNKYGIGPGGIAGTHYGSDCYFYTASTVVGTSALTQAAMQTAATFTPTWDFATVWTISPGSYPYLRWQGSSNIPY